MNSNEREQRLKQIRERWSRMNTPQTVFTSHCKGDIDFLLSLLDSQAAEPVTYYNEDGSYNPVGTNIADHAATRMRDQCVAKVREKRKDWQVEAEARRDPDNPHDYKGSYGLASGAVDACDDIITALSPLTMDVEQKEAK